MEKRNRISNQKKTRTPNGVNNENENKHFSKSKFKNDNLLQEQKEDTPLKKKNVGKRNVDFYAKRLNDIIQSRHHFSGTPVKTETLVLTQPSELATGFSVLSKGQCVRVMTFEGSDKRLVVSEDGRQGIISLESGAKKIAI